MTHYLQLVWFLADDFCLLQKWGQSCLLLLQDPFVDGIGSSLLRSPPPLRPTLLKSPGIKTHPTNTCSPSGNVWANVRIPERELWTMKCLIVHKYRTLYWETSPCFGFVVQMQNQSRPRRLGSQCEDFQAARCTPSTWTNAPAITTITLEKPHPPKK